MVDIYCEACGTSLDYRSRTDHMCSTTRSTVERKGWAGLHKATAIIDPQEAYRYRLTRDLVDGNEKTMTFVMLNPSIG